MQNLFIMHTQYNLILACALVKNRYKNDKNILMLYAEFDLSQEIKNNLEDCFYKVYYIREKYTSTANTFARNKAIIEYLKKSKEAYKQKYDNVFLSQENLYDTYVLTKISKHSSFKCYSIEEDVYYSVRNELNINPPTKKKSSFVSKILNVLLTVIAGKNKYYRFGYFYGQSEIYDGNYVLFPNQVRKEMQNNNLLEISAEELYSGIEALYEHIKTADVDSNDIVLCFFDLIERYTDKEKIKDLANTIEQLCKINNKTLIVKYHPRETEKIAFLQAEKVIEIPSVIPAEKVLYDYKSKNVTVIGNLTTSLWVASKAGFDTISLVGMENPENITAINALKGMNIKILENIEQMEKDGLL